MRLKLNKEGNYFHPFELAIFGHKKSGKSKLINKIIQNLAKDFDIGHIELSCDQQAKQIDIQHSSIDKDFLLIEDRKISQIPKLVLINEDENYDMVIDQIDKEQITQIIGIISSQPLDPFNNKFPFFHKDEINKISSFILDYFHKKIPLKLNGLILTGGKSSRMKEDKASLKYHNQLTQIEYTESLLKSICEKVYISCSKEQINKQQNKAIDSIVDSYPSQGPITGILSAQFHSRQTEKNCAWLVIACDLPYLDKATIIDLVNNRNPFKNATCFLSSSDGFPEPLCTIYEPKSYLKLLKYFSSQKYCPRKVLINSNIKALNLINEEALNNVNTPEQRQIALETLGQGTSNVN